MVMHPILIVRATDGMVSCVVPTLVSFGSPQPSGTIVTACRLMVSVVRVGVAQRLHRLVAGRPSGVVRCRISFVRHARSVWHSEARNQVCKLICITFRITQVGASDFPSRKPPTRRLGCIRLLCRTRLYRSLFNGLRANRICCLLVR